MPVFVYRFFVIFFFKQGFILVCILNLCNATQFMSNRDSFYLYSEARMNYAVFIFTFLFCAHNLSGFDLHNDRISLRMVIYSNYAGKGRLVSAGRWVIISG